MKIICTGCTHGSLPVIPSCDLFLLSGDICPVYNHSVEFQVDWLNKTFLPWWKDIPCYAAYFIPGNHDFVFQSKQYQNVSDELKEECLIDEEGEYDGLLIYGTPWVPYLPGWAYCINDIAAMQRYERIPPGINLILSHSPPFGYGDRVTTGEHVGSKPLLKSIDKIKPEYIVNSHIHEDFGQYQYNDTTIYNVSYLNEQYIPTNNPVEINI